MPSSDLIVRATGLTKRYRDAVALDGVDLGVARGRVHGLLGPNGAGKTTAVRILTTLTRFDAGEATVAGHDVRTEPRKVRRAIALTGQQTAVDDLLTARQNLRMFGRLFRLDKGRAARRADELLEQFDLADAADRPPKQFSGGMRRRLDLAASMILAPQVLFLDEPTTGLDPAGRREVWRVIRELAAQGTTVLLTTHYLDEADQLSDRITVIHNGRNLVDDTPAGLKRRIGDERLEVTVTDLRDLGTAAEIVSRAAGNDPAIDEAEGVLSVPVSAGVRALTDVAAQIRAQGLDVADIGLRRPSLDEAFLQLIGSSSDPLVTSPPPSGVTPGDAPPADMMEPSR